MMEEPQESGDRDVARVSQELASRLRARNITVRDSDSSDSILAMAEAVENFERAVQAAGGDLMMAEPPSSAGTQGEDTRFLLPQRADDESAGAYVRRLDAATSALGDDSP